jgi:hypothetical protein
MCSLNMGSINFAFHDLAAKERDWQFPWERKYILDSPIAAWIVVAPLIAFNNCATRYVRDKGQFRHWRGACRSRTLIRRRRCAVPFAPLIGMTRLDTDR